MTFALSVVALAGAFLLLLGLAALFAPPRAQSFLRGFAATPVRHYLELALRIAAGVAFMVTSSLLQWSQFFFAAGLVLVGTTAVMAVLPYKIHRAFAQRAVSSALPYLPFIGIVSLVAGSAVAWSAYAASVA